MAADTVLLVGALVAAGTYLLLGRGFLSVLFGFALLSNAANLLVLATSGPPDGRRAPIAAVGAGPLVDPLPQAMILTAIVIGFGTLVYMLLLFYRLYLDHGTVDVARLFAEDSGGDGDSK